MTKDFISTLQLPVSHSNILTSLQPKFFDSHPPISNPWPYLKGAKTMRRMTLRRAALCRMTLTWGLYHKTYYGRNLRFP
jgi:hypothetical protein